MPFNLLTPDMLTDMAYARHRDALAASGVRLIPDDIARINELVAADPGLAEADAVVDDDEHRMRLFRACVRRAMTEVAKEILASGVDRSLAPQYNVLGSPEPSIWANGATLQRVAETALQELDELAAVASMNPVTAQLRSISGLGTLYTIEEVADLLRVTPTTLAQWRREAKFFEFIKFPGGRGLVRYTERGIRAFFANHTAGPVAV